MSKNRQVGATARRREQHAAADATVRVGGAQGIPDVLRSLGIDPAEVLAEQGLDPKLFDDPDNLMSYAQRSRLLSHCVARTGCAHFGLLVGQRGSLYSLGLVGFLVKYSPDVGTALHSLVRYLHLHVRGAATSLELHGDMAMLAYDIHDTRVQATDQVADGAVALMFNILRALCGPDWKPSEVRLAHRMPPDPGPWRRYFRAPLRFDAERNALLFPADWLEHGLPGADAELRGLLQKQIDALEARHAEEFPLQVRSVLRTALMTRHAKAEQVAALFSMHSRTLHRRLHAFGTSFHQLLDEGRFEIARQLLEDTSMDLSQVASELDYADASAFGRAFRRWTASSPARWRAQRRKQVPRKA